MAKEANSNHLVELEKSNNDDYEDDYEDDFEDGVNRTESSIYESALKFYQGVYDSRTLMTGHQIVKTKLSEESDLTKIHTNKKASEKEDTFNEVGNLEKTKEESNNHQSGIKNRIIDTTEKPEEKPEKFKETFHGDCCVADYIGEYNVFKLTSIKGNLIQNLGFFYCQDGSRCQQHHAMVSENGTLG